MRLITAIYNTFVFSVVFDACNRFDLFRCIFVSYLFLDIDYSFYLCGRMDE